MNRRHEWEFTWVHKAVLVAFLDAIIVLFSYLMALLARFDFKFSEIPLNYIEGYLWSMPFWVAATIVVFYVCRLYHSVWSLASISEIQMSVVSYMILLVVYLVGTLFMRLRMPRSYYFMGYIISFGLTTALRFSYRILRFYLGKSETDADATDRIMIIGGGAAGQILIKELTNGKRFHTKVCCVIDDNPDKLGRVLEGIPIVGNRNDILTMVKKYKINHIIYAIPATTGKNRKEILNICKETDCKLQTVPSVAQLINGEVNVTRIRDVEITDLLGRAQVKVNNQEILTAIRNQVVLVTGGGGSIGSELCRQIAKAGPKSLIIFDIYENNAYEIQQELKRTHKNLEIVVLIGSVRNNSRINWVMDTYKPDIVYHAAAHKHVPLMEESPNEAIKNNVIGTYKTAKAAARVGVRKFVFISTDKAVNPTNIMGASKRLCEMVIQMMDRRCDSTDFVAVRFGNVLGSNGSVIPLFKKQIAEGGPVTVTDKDIIRYFMTIPEAVSLVLQASYYAKGGEIFILDMGEPVRIDDMARNLIRLSGYTPDVDIPIVYTGLRPGEKLYEELLMSEEGMQDTENELIHIGHPIDMDDEWFEERLGLLEELSSSESNEIKRVVAEIVPTYQYMK
ncbi:MAG: polysaccharide biosynthesis protein [Dorea sp.]|nr:polysaccharide biosynthesis protein [Dorea sp.]